jgi:hypothetical protein
MNYLKEITYQDFHGLFISTFSEPVESAVFRNARVAVNMRSLIHYIQLLMKGTAFWRHGIY